MFHGYWKLYYSSNYEVDIPLQKGMNKKVKGLMKDELGGKIITEFVALRPKTYSNLTLMTIKIAYLKMKSY